MNLCLEHYTCVELTGRRVLNFKKKQNILYVWHEGRNHLAGNKCYPDQISLIEAFFTVECFVVVKVEVHVNTPR